MLQQEELDQPTPEPQDMTSSQTGSDVTAAAVDDVTEELLQPSEKATFDFEELRFEDVDDDEEDEVELFVVTSQPSRLKTVGTQYEQVE